MHDQYEAEASAVKRIKIRRELTRLEYQLSWQGANPKLLDREELRAVITQPLFEDVNVDASRARVKNPKTAIRAYCLTCQGGGIADVRMCQSVTCPLHSFRMGRDPLRGFELPKAEEVEIDDDLTADTFADEEDDDDSE